VLHPRRSEDHNNLFPLQRFYFKKPFYFSKNNNPVQFLSCYTHLLSTTPNWKCQYIYILKAQGSFDFPTKQVLVYGYLRHYSRQQHSPILCSFIQPNWFFFMASKSLFFQRILILKPVLSELRAAEVANLHSLMTFKKQFCIS